MADIYSPAAVPGLAAPAGPSSQAILDVLSNMAPRDPAAVNPATTAAMARSRDAITRTLERQMRRQEDPFQGLNDVATAAITALATKHRTPFGRALEELDTNRDTAQLRTATALGQQAQREANAGGKAISPYQSAQLMMQTLKFQASRGDKDAQLAEQAIDNIRTSLAPEDSVGFVVDAHAALQEAQRRKGSPLSGQESVAVVTQQARGGGYKIKQPNLQMQVNPITGDREYFNPSPYGGARAPQAPAAPGPGAEPVLNRPGAVAQAPLAPQPPLTPSEAGVSPGAPGLPPTRGPGPQAQAPAAPEPARNIPALVQKENIKGLGETQTRVDAILRAREAAKNTPHALGWQGYLIDNLGGMAQQVERAIGAPGALGTEKWDVNKVSGVRDQLNLLFARLIPTITGDASGRYSNFDIQLASTVARFKTSTSSPEQAIGFLTLVRDIELRSLNRQLRLAGESGRSLYETFSPEVKEALRNPAVVGPDGDAPYDDFKFVGPKLYVRLKGTQQWAELQR